MTNDKDKLAAGDRAIVSTLIESKAVDFELIGTTLARFGPSAALELEGEDVFCGTMRRFVRVFRLGDPLAELSQLEQLREIGPQIHG